MSAAPRPVGVLLTDAQMKIVAWDDWLVRITGLSAEAVRGRSLVELVPDLETRGVAELLRTVLTTGNVALLAPAVHEALIPCPPPQASPYFERNDGVSTSEWTQNDRGRVDHFNDLLRQLASKSENQGKVLIVELGKWLCPDSGPCREQIDGVKVRDDGLHYGPGAKVVAKWLAPQFRELAIAHPKR